MKLRGDVPLPSTAAMKHGFETAQHGHSVWFATETEYATMTNSFKRWAAKSGSTLKTTARKVGREDPEGKGYRVWFVQGSVK
jgi:hypothetical protein